MNVLSKIARKGKLVIAGALVAVALATVGTVIYSSQASAATCDKVNIIHCGLDGSSTSGYIKSLQAFYHRGSDNGHSDLKAIYNWAGLATVNIDAMNTSNTKVGTLYRNGDIKVDGKVVATDAWVSARFTSGNGFVKIKDGVWARKTTTSFANPSVKVLVHFKGDGTFDGAVMVDCGNAIKATNKVVPPKPVLKCDKLTVSHTGNATSRSYTYTATASAKNTKIVSYTFKFSDGTSKTVSTSSSKASASHSYTSYSKSYKTVAYVSGSSQKNVTGADCDVTVKTPAAPAKPELKCVSLKASATSTARNYTYTATASAKDTKIVSYTFKFGDGTTKTVSTSSTTATASHAYSDYNKSYKTVVYVNGTDQKNVTGADCDVTVTTPKPPVKPELTCEDLSFKAASTALAYTFTAKANAKDTKIVSYTFKFSDGTSKTVTTDNTTASLAHTFADYDKSYTATVYVNGKDQSNVTSPDCKVTVKTPSAPKQPVLVCESLTFKAVADKDLTYTFTAKANATNTKITNYVFNFGDGKTMTVPTDATTATTEHTFAQNSQTYTATVAVNGTDQKNVTSVDCKVIVKTPEAPCVPKEGEDENCQPKPCVPTETQDQNCNEKPCVPTETQDENCNEQPEELVNTGPGAVAGLFAGTSALGAAAHQIIRRRKNRE